MKIFAVYLLIIRNGGMNISRSARAAGIKGRDRGFVGDKIGRRLGSYSPGGAKRASGRGPTLPPSCGRRCADDGTRAERALGRACRGIRFCGPGRDRAGRGEPATNEARARIRRAGQAASAFTEIDNGPDGDHAGGRAEPAPAWAPRRRGQNRSPNRNPAPSCAALRDAARGVDAASPCSRRAERFGGSAGRDGQATKRRSVMSSEAKATFFKVSTSLGVAVRMTSAPT
jgi:hypothetical protein